MNYSSLADLMNGCIKCLSIIYIEATAFSPILSQNVCTDVPETYFSVVIKETFNTHKVKLVVGIEFNPLTGDYQNKNEPCHFFLFKCKVQDLSINPEVRLLFHQTVVFGIIL